MIRPIRHMAKEKKRYLKICNCKEQTIQTQGYQDYCNMRSFFVVNVIHFSVVISIGKKCYINIWDFVVKYSTLHKLKFDYSYANYRVKTSISCILIGIIVRNISPIFSK